MVGKLLLSVLLVGGLVCSAGTSLAQTAPTQEHLSQTIIVNGQQAQGVMVIQNGTVQSYTCPSPQQYVAADQSSSGWACLDEVTGTWLMRALPGKAARFYDLPAVYYDGPAIYGSNAYPYAYYPFPYYGYYGGPSFLFGFGFGHGRYAPFGRGYYGGPHIGGPFGYGTFGHGSFGHGSFGHWGGGYAGGGRR